MIPEPLPLRDIHLPEPSLSLLPYLFQLAMIVLLVFLLFSAFLFFKKITKPTLKKEAKKKLEEISRSYDETQDGVKCLAELSIFLRQLMISKTKIKETAGLAGEAWLKLLKNTFNEPNLDYKIGELLLFGPYQQNVCNDRVSELLRICLKWVKSL